MDEFSYSKSADRRGRQMGNMMGAQKDCGANDIWQQLLTNENIIQFCALCACTVLVAYMLTEFIGCEPCAAPEPKITKTPTYGYTVFNGPHTWSINFPAAAGSHQSPINIIINDVCCVSKVPCICWRNYSCMPDRLTLSNNGMAVVLRGVWPDVPPSINGYRGVVEGTYIFQAAFFRWGMSDDEGSEHTINFMSYAMELQVLHSRTVAQPPQPAMIMVSYLFEITEVDNPYLDQVILALQHIVFPGKCMDLQPFPLLWIAPPFQDQYFAYEGSLSFPPCCEDVRWIVRPVSIGISVRQSEQFRQLLGWDGPLNNNLRPVQCVNGRDVYYYPPCSPCTCDFTPHLCDENRNPSFCD